MPRHILIAYVEDKPGVLNRVASLFRRRNFNIESLTVGRTEQFGVSRMTIVMDTNEAGARIVEAHLYKLVNVLRVDDLTHKRALNRELALVKVAVSPEARVQVLQLVEVFRARVIDVEDAAVVIEVTGTPEKIDKFELMMRSYGIVEMVRTGSVAMARGKEAIGPNPPLVPAEVANGTAPAQPVASGLATPA
jgi:acetolactate synthase I/III small subunit